MPLQTTLSSHSRLFLQGYFYRVKAGLHAILKQLFNMHFLYDFVAISAPVDATFGQGMGIIVLDEINCTGTERRLIDCPHNGVGITDCAHDEDAGVVCARECCI